MGNCITLDCCSDVKENKQAVAAQSPKIQLKMKPRGIETKTEIKTQLEGKDRYHSSELASDDFKDVEIFTFNGLVTKTKVVSVYDGDTITIGFYYCSERVKDNFRMLGYDAPEMKPKKNIEHRELQIKAAQIARDKLSKLITDQVVWVKFSSEEKYGRLMGEIFMMKSESLNHFIGSEINVNQWMIANGFGKTYDGGKKGQFSKQDLEKIIARG